MKLYILRQTHNPTTLIGLLIENTLLREQTPRAQLPHRHLCNTHFFIYGFNVTKSYNDHRDRQVSSTVSLRGPTLDV